MATVEEGKVKLLASGSDALPSPADKKGSFTMRFLRGFGLQLTSLSHHHMQLRHAQKAQGSRLCHRHTGNRI